MKSIYSLIMLAMIMLVGCSTIDNIEVNRERGADTTWVVVVGMENSKFAGTCSGAGIDAERMSVLLRNYTGNIKVFQSETATKEAVATAMTEAARNAELFIFYYSGHGGQGKFWDTGIEEKDGQDEYLCFYDTYMRDNEVWRILKQSKGRVMCIFDACHSETLYRGVKPITLKGVMPLGVTHQESGEVNLTVWSGCPENTYSYGNCNGGKFTNTLLRYFSVNKTYEYLWSEIESDIELKKHEEVQRTLMGNGFVGKQIFK